MPPGVGEIHGYVKLSALPKRPTPESHEVVYQPSLAHSDALQSASRGSDQRRYETHSLHGVHQPTLASTVRAEKSPSRASDPREDHWRRPQSAQQRQDAGCGQTTLSHSRRMRQHLSEHEQASLAKQVHAECLKALQAHEDIEAILRLKRTLISRISDELDATRPAASKLRDSLLQAHLRCEPTDELHRLTVELGRSIEEAL
mmetsp:Transcript_40753/g.93805  ORF Transcript_40753/g.93805 Transcript_40753/m.93805 type:complete len:202 (-) Transcript_40753:25-630(-)